MNKPRPHEVLLSYIRAVRTDMPHAHRKDVVIEALRRVKRSHPEWHEDSFPRQTPKNLISLYYQAFSKEIQKELSSEMDKLKVAPPVGPSTPPVEEEPGSQHEYAYRAHSNIWTTEVQAEIEEIIRNWIKEGRDLAGYSQERLFLSAASYLCQIKNWNRNSLPASSNTCTASLVIRKAKGTYIPTKSDLERRARKAKASSSLPANNPEPEKVSGNPMENLRKLQSQVKSQAQARILELESIISKAQAEMKEHKETVAEISLFEEYRNQLNRTDEEPLRPNSQL